MCNKKKFHHRFTLEYHILNKLQTLLGKLHVRIKVIRGRIKILLRRPNRQIHSSLLITHEYIQKPRIRQLDVLNVARAQQTRQKDFAALLVANQVAVKTRLQPLQVLHQLNPLADLQAVGSLAREPCQLYQRLTTLVNTRGTLANKSQCLNAAVLLENSTGFQAILDNTDLLGLKGSDQDLFVVG